eukprot:GFUD01012082.1.p1 GENE.GFUD01012082.1~~GFUD01012082.1.p1  ORF type:complete len:277 (+),score=53.60 GFUD01012082.1:149-979(+)
MSMSKVGNQTSSQDPQAVNSRAFVGNLNTFQVVKTDVEKIFQKYGRIAGISMHKGYAFVQFTSPFDARSACLGEDGKSLCGQVLDVNMVSEPKAHVTKGKAIKRQKEKGEVEQQVMSNQPLLQYYMNSLVGGTAVQTSFPTAKRPRVEDANGDTNDSETTDNDMVMDEEIDLDTLKTYSTPDILICGNCRMIFDSLHSLVSHKRHYCKLRFTCKCEEEDKTETEMENSVPAILQCSSCNQDFEDPWDLMEHVQDVHSLNIYQLCDDNQNLPGVTVQ